MDIDAVKAWMKEVGRRRLWSFTTAEADVVWDDARRHINTLIAEVERLAADNWRIRGEIGKRTVADCRDQ